MDFQKQEGLEATLSYSCWVSVYSTITWLKKPQGPALLAGCGDGIPGYETLGASVSCLSSP